MVKSAILYYTWPPTVKRPAQIATHIDFRWYGLNIIKSLFLVLFEWFQLLVTVLNTGEGQ